MMEKRIEDYLKKHYLYNSLVHLVAGIGVGIIIARPLVANPVKWGVALVIVGVIGHLYPLTLKHKK